MTKAKQTVWRFQPWMPDGTRESFSFATKKERDEFVSQFGEKRRRIRLGLSSSLKAPLIKDLAAIYLSDREKEIGTDELTLPGFNKLEEHFRLHIVPEIGHIPVDTVGVAGLELFLDNLCTKRIGKTKLSAASRNRIRSTLHGFFKQARKRGYVPYNIVDDVPRKTEKANPHPMLKSLADVQTWVNAAYGLSEHQGIMEMFLVNTGARIGQAQAVQWQDYDEALSRVWMGKIYERASRTIQHRVKGRKEHEGFWVGVNDSLKAALKRWAGLGIVTPEGYILSPHGTAQAVPMNPEAFYKLHNQVQDATKLRMTPHGARHLLGSQYLAAGGTTEGAQHQLGHRSKDTTEQFYIHAVKHDLSARANVFQVAPTKVGAGLSEVDE